MTGAPVLELNAAFETPSDDAGWLSFQFEEARTAIAEDTRRTQAEARSRSVPVADQLQHEELAP